MNPSRMTYLWEHPFPCYKELTVPTFSTHVYKQIVEILELWSGREQYTIDFSAAAHNPATGDPFHKEWVMLSDA